MMGALQPPEHLFDNEPYYEDTSDETGQESFQERLEDIFKEYGVSVLRNPARIMTLMDDAGIDRKSRNVFRTILMTEAVALLISYAKNEVREEALIRRCRTMLRDDWGLSEDAFMPVMKQLLNAIDGAVKERTDSVGKTICNHTVITRRTTVPDRVHVILVNEDLGY